MYRRRQGCGTTRARREQFWAGFPFQGPTQRGAAKLASVQGSLSKAADRLQLNLRRAPRD